MFKWYMTEKVSLQVLNIGVLMYGFLKFYCICTFCTGLPVLPTDMYWFPAFYLLVCTCMYSLPVVCTRLLTSRQSYVLVSCRMDSSPDL